MTDQERNQNGQEAEMQRVANFLTQRVEHLSPAISKLMQVAGELATEGFNAIDIAEACGVAGANAVLLMTPETFRQDVHNQASKIYAETLTAMRKRKVGLGTKIVAQVVAQCNVLSYVSSSAAQLVSEVKERGMKEEKKNDGSKKTATS